MPRPRIMVFQMRDIIKIAMIALIGIILISFLIFFLIPKKTATEALYIPGTYTAQIVLHSKPVDIAVTVTGNEITDIELKNMNEKQEVFYPLFIPTSKELAKQIIKYQSTKIATSPEKAVTSRIILDAVESALAQASAAVARK